MISTDTEPITFPLGLIAIEISCFSEIENNFLPSYFHVKYSEISVLCDIPSS